MIMKKPVVILSVSLLLFTGFCQQQPDSIPGEKDSQAVETAVKKDLWCNHTILVYVDPMSRTADFWAGDKLNYLAAYRNPEGTYEDFFFDGFLIIGYVCEDDRTLLPLQRNKPAIQSDWESAIESFLAGAVRVSDAVLAVSKELDKDDYKAKVILTLPYPDTRQTNFGPIEGTSLNFTNRDDQLSGLKWYIDEMLQQWNEYEKENRLDGVRLAGFYWLSEGIRENDYPLIKDLSAYIHAKDFLLHWIPCYGCGTSIFSKLPLEETGLDHVTQQINYQNPDKRARPLSIFEDKTKVVEAYGMHGVEMTPVARAASLNPRVHSWHQVWLANLEAALRLNWEQYEAITYFNGNNMPDVASDPETHIFYEQLYKWTKGTLTWNDLDTLADVVVEELHSQGVLTEARLAKIKEADRLMERLSVLEKLYWMEKPLPEATQ